MKAVRPLLSVAVNQGQQPWLLQSSGARRFAHNLSGPSDLQLLSQSNRFSETLPLHHSGVIKQEGMGCQNGISARNSRKSVKDSIVLSSRSIFLKRYIDRQKGGKRSTQKHSNLPKINIEAVNGLIETPVDVGSNLERTGCVSYLSLVSPSHSRKQGACVALIPAAVSSGTETFLEADEREIVEDVVKRSGQLSRIKPIVANKHIISEEDLQTILCEVVEKPIRTPRGLEDIVEQHALKLCKDFLTAAGTEEDIHFTFVGARQLPPLVAAEYSCIYFLELPSGYFYVGESDNILERIKCHRRRLKGAVRFAFAMLPFGRSHAQKLEKVLIDKLLTCRVPVTNRGDQHRKHFGSATKIL